MSHSFEEKTFSHLTYCGVCTKLLWGIVKQGVECKECHYACHHKCQSSAPKCLKASVPARFLDDTSAKDSRAEKYLRQLKQRSEALPPSSSASTTNSMDTQVDISEEEEESTYQHICAIATSDKLHTILADAITNQDEPVNAYLANQAPLNPQITAKNFSRFVSRCGPVFAFRDELILLLSWKNRVDTLVSLIVYCSFCLYPKLLLFVPQAFLIYFILSNHPNNKKSDKKTNEKDKKSGKSVVKDKIKSSSSTPTSRRRSSDDMKRNLPDSLLSFGLATLFQPASDESPEYLKNLQNIQNTMGEFSDMYDWIMTQSSHFNWSSETETMRILQLIIFTTFICGIVIYSAPLNMIFLYSGLIIYGVNTRFSKYIIRELQPYVVQSCKRKAEDLKEKYIALEAKYERQDQLEEISVFENQRWWPERGYLHEMAEGERSPWSNFLGTVYMPIITEIPAPKGYQWKETSEWKLDTIGPWVDDYLGIEISITPSKDGWIYSDDKWNISNPQVTPVDNEEEEQHKKAMTRRRRWVRECETISS